MKLKLCAALLSLPVWASAQAQTPAVSEVPQVPAPAALTAALGPVFGSAQSQQGGSDAWFFAKPGRPLPAGTMVKTEAGSYCLIFFSDGTKLRLGPKSNLRLTELSAQKAEVALGSGRLEAWVKKRESAEFQAQTPLFTAALPEGSFAADILSPTSATLDIFTGDPKVQDSLGKSQTVSPGQRVELDAKTGASTPAPLPSGALRPEEPSLAGPAKPAGAKEPAAVPPAPAPQKPVVKAKPAVPAVAKSTQTAQPAPAKPEATPGKAKPAEPPAPAKSAQSELDSQL